MTALQKTRTLIIGGGLHAIALAARLHDTHGDSEFAIIDPRRLGSEWLRGTSAQGLTTLRTPYAAHLGPSDDPEELLRLEYDTRHDVSGCGGHVRQRASGHAKQVTEPARVETFNRHLGNLVGRYNLEAKRVAGWATDIRHTDGAFVTSVATRDGRLDYVSEKVVIAVGLGKPWTPYGGPTHHRVMHSHDVDVRFRKFSKKRLCIIGGGLTAATLATHYAAQGNHVSLCSRSSITVGQLEAHPDWRPGQPLQEKFAQVTSKDERLRQLKAARVGSSVTPEVWTRLTRMVDYDELMLHEQAPVEGWEIIENDKIRLPHVGKEVDAAIFATGYRLSAPELPFMHSILPKISLTGGMPHVDADLESENIPGLFFAGRLGELGAGPLTRNIPGAQYGSVRIANGVQY